LFYKKVLCFLANDIADHFPLLLGTCVAGDISTFENVNFKNTISVSSITQDKSASSFVTCKNNTMVLRCLLINIHQVKVAIKCKYSQTCTCSHLCLVETMTIGVKYEANDRWDMKMLLLFHFISSSLGYIKWNPVTKVWIINWQQTTEASSCLTCHLPHTWHQLSSFRLDSMTKDKLQSTHIIPTYSYVKIYSTTLKVLVFLHNSLVFDKVLYKLCLLWIKKRSTGREAHFVSMGMSMICWQIFLPFIWQTITGVIN
jgi:hypothetical protein